MSTIMMPLDKVLVSTLKSISLMQLLDELGRLSQKLVTVRESNSVEHVLNTLSTFRISAVPVSAEDGGKYLGFVDVLDIVNFVIEIATEGKELDESQWINKLRDFDLPRSVQKRFLESTARELINISKRNEYYSVYGAASVYQLIEDLFSKGVHRVMVLDEDKKLVGILTQSDVISFISKNYRIMETARSQTVSELGLGTAPIVYVSHNTQALFAFYIMKIRGVSAVAVTAPDETFFANFSASDIQGLSVKNFSDIMLPISDFIAKHGGKPPVTCRIDTSFEALIFKLNVFKVHRVWMLDQAGRPIKVISMTDVMKKIAGID